MRVRLDLRYDGTAFSGWAAQPGLRTVEGDLVAALGRVARLSPPPRLVVAGRTDAGVHARGQVAHADLPQAAWLSLPGRSAAEPGESLVRRLAGVLGPDLVVRTAALADPGFDARFSAVWRRYAYRVADSTAARDPLRRADVLWLRDGRRLDVAAMTAAADPLLGRHDFQPFCKPRPGATTVRTLQELRWERCEDDLLVAQVRADAFCHHMVRSLVGAVLAVGRGARPATWPAAVLAAGRRDNGVQVSPAHGLTLEEVGYPRAERMAGRALAARARREEPSGGP